MDAHCKLEKFGIQIYAAIDAYSRNIIWVYVGVSARTLISVLKQFAVAVKKTRRTPRLVRVDKGKETTMAAAFQYGHARRVRAHEGLWNCTFRSTWCFGTSTTNQRIESWWQQMSRGRLSAWLVSRLRASKLSHPPAMQLYRLMQCRIFSTALWRKANMTRT